MIMIPSGRTSTPYGKATRVGTIVQGTVTRIHASASLGLAITRAAVMRAPGVKAAKNPHQLRYTLASRSTTARTIALCTTECSRASVVVAGFPSERRGACRQGSVVVC